MAGMQLMAAAMKPGIATDGCGDRAKETTISIRLRIATYAEVGMSNGQKLSTLDEDRGSIEDPIETKDASSPTVTAGIRSSSNSTFERVRMATGKESPKANLGRERFEGWRMPWGLGVISSA